MNNKKIRAYITRREALKKIGVGAVANVLMAHIGISSFVAEQEKNGVPQPLIDVKPIQARIDIASGAPRLLINGKPIRARMFYGGPSTASFNSQVELASEAGIDLITFENRLPWLAPDKPLDYKGMDLLLQRVLSECPKALLLPRIDMDPPAWWFQSHPDEAMTWEISHQDQPNKQKRLYAVPGQVYRRDACQQLDLLIRHLEEQFGDRIVGYHPCGQNTGEWFYQDTWGPFLNGYSKGDRREWRIWLKKRYGNNKTLRNAWKEKRITFDEAEVPTAEARHAAPYGILRDPVEERKIIDFTEFQQELMAGCVCELAHTARLASSGRKLVVFFFGYEFEFSTVKTGPAVSGHYDLRQVLQCPDIDILCSPISYDDRKLGDNGSTMTTAESVSLAGKMWLTEDDTRTFLSKTTSYGGVQTLSETRQLLLRNTGQCALRNFATWWMDLGGTGWFNDPEIWAEMIRLKTLDQSLLQNPLPYRPQVAAVIDSASLIRVAAGGNVVSSQCVSRVRTILGRMGSPYGQYLLDDVISGKVKAKLYVMLATWYIVPEQIKQLLDYTHGSVKLWCYAPGYLNPQGTSLDTMYALTGFRFRRVELPNALAQPTTKGKHLGLQDVYGIPEVVKPLFAVADAEDEETLACYSDGSAAIAMRQTPDGFSIFAGTPGLTSGLLRLAAHQAGVHLFTEVDCNVYNNGPYTVVHTSQDGPLTVDTGCSSHVLDMLSGENLGKGPKIVLPLKKGETRVIKCA